jgi:hypothetical protein
MTPEAPDMPMISGSPVMLYPPCWTPGVYRRADADKLKPFRGGVE